MSNRAPESSGQHSDASKRSSLSGTSSSSQQPKKPVGQTPVSTNTTTAGRGVRYLYLYIFVIFTTGSFSAAIMKAPRALPAAAAGGKTPVRNLFYLFCCSEMFLASCTKEN
jgi:hypothetical protein